MEQRFLQPDGWQWGEMQSQGFNIRFGYASPEKPDAIVVCLPGLSEFCEKYFETARDVLKRDMAFWVIDWPGQGRSERMLKNSQARHSYGFHVERNVLHDLFKNHIEPSNTTGVPHVMLAHSMGGHIGLRFLHSYPWVFQAAAFSAPMWGLAGLKSIPAPALVTGLAQMYFGASYAPGQSDWNADVRDNDATNIFSHDETRRRIHNAWCMTDPALQVGGVTWRWLHEAARSFKIIRHKKFLRDIQAPCFIAVAGQDALIDNDATLRIAKSIPHGEVMTFETSFHEILMERDEIRSAFLEKFFKLAEETKGH